VSRSALALIVAAGFVGCAEPPPQEFLSVEHKFRVRFGRPPKVEEKGEVVRSVVYAVRSRDGLLAVIVTDLPRPDDDPADRVPVYLANARNDLMRATGGTLTADEAVVLAGKHPGRALTARVTVPQSGVLRGRLYFVGKRLYQVTAVGTDAFVNAPNATAFLESCAVTE
jgi:hypothetical protein